MKSIYKRITAVAAGLVITALSVYSIILDDKRIQLENEVSGFYQESFEEIVSDMDSLKAKLSKLEAASDKNQYSILLMDVWRQAGDTESSIAALPVSYQSTSTLTQFMNRTGDYCRYLSTKLARNEELSKEDMAQVRKLAEACGEVSLKVNELWQQGYGSGLGLSELEFLAEETTGSQLDFTNQEFPRLIYDGPFSESTEDKQPEGLGSKAFSKEEARAAAEKFLGMGVNTLELSGELNGTIPSFGFTGELGGRPVSIYISKQGGQVLWYMSQRDTGISAVPTDERYEHLRAVAQQYLKNKGYGSTAPSYAQFYGGMAIINLAPIENDIVLYPDLIKVWVDISGNDVAGMEAQNYLMSHKKRSLPAPELTKEDAQKMLNPDMLVTNTRLALIPLDSNEEKLCWEFTCTVNGNNFLVYINAKTGMEEDILMIQDTNDGKLVM